MEVIDASGMSGTTHEIGDFASRYGQGNRVGRAQGDARGLQGGQVGDG